MLNITLITVGSLKENYLKQACAEYQKRLSAFCRLNLIELKEYKLSESPSKKEIDKALQEEAERILSAMPERAYKLALVIEGKQLSSEELAEKLERVSAEYGELCLVIGSSHGLSQRVKSACHMGLSVSKLTFPHQLMRVMLLEIIYRALNISKGTKYHK